MDLVLVIFTAVMLCSTQPAQQTMATIMLVDKSIEYMVTGERTMVIVNPPKDVQYNPNDFDWLNKKR